MRKAVRKIFHCEKLKRNNIIARILQAQNFLRFCLDVRVLQSLDEGTGIGVLEVGGFMEYVLSAP
jgi:hypothetical protein